VIAPKLHLLGPANLTDLNNGILSNMEDENQNIKQVSRAVCHIPELSIDGLHLFMVITTDVYCSFTRTIHATIRTFTHAYLRTIHNIFPVSFYVKIYMGTAVAQWLRCCATNRKVAGSIPGDVIGIYH